MLKRRGIILAGGSGSRLQPMTGLLSKQVLPVYDKPMIYYPLSVLMLAKITDILVITAPNHFKQISNMLIGLGDIGVSFQFIIQEEPRGIADALLLAQDFLDGSPCALILGDNIFFGHGFGEMLKDAGNIEDGARVFVYPVNDPERYGVLELDDSDEIKSIVEKPKTHVSDLAVTGLYFYDGNASLLASKLKPSSRGELEITDLNRLYLEMDKLSFCNLGRGFAWFDAGTPASLLDASNFVSTVERRQGLSIGVPEEIALDNAWIHSDDLRRLPNAQKKNDYAQYLARLIEKVL